MTYKLTALAKKAPCQRRHQHQRASGNGIIYLLLLTAACLLFAPAAFASDQCPAAEHAVRGELNALRLLQSQSATGGQDNDDGSVSPQQQAAIRVYKQALVDTIDAQLACSDAGIQAAELQKTLAALISRPLAGQPPQGSTPASGGPAFGANLDVGVERADISRPLMLIRSGFSIPCGDDNVLVGYAWEQNRWHRVLRWQAGDYKDISGAYGDVFGSLALPGGQVVVVHGTPWCTSNLSRFDIDVIAPENGASSAQHTLFHASHGYRRDPDMDRALLTLNRRADGFEIRAQISSRDTDILIRPGIFRYAVTDGTVRRVQPAAANGRDFVDEWLTVDDALARAWSDPEQADVLLKARKQIADYALTYGPVRACERGTRLYQVELDLSKLSSGANGAEEKRYVVIRQESNGFTAMSLKNTADASCRGGDLMPRR